MISEDEVKHVAKLTKLRFSDHEIQNLQHQLGSIMRMVQEMREVNCNGVEPLSSVCEQVASMRDDVVTESDLGGVMFTNTPGKDAAFAKEIKCFIVPKVVE
jgi:aspartyl-tRNA(Asn)/glutamyl-tRNA(Gln) amidotransferase subunit C